MMDLPSSPPTANEAAAASTTHTNITSSSPPALPSRPSSTGGGTPNSIMASPKNAANKRKASVHFDKTTILEPSGPFPKKVKVAGGAAPRRKIGRTNRPLPIARSLSECEEHDKALIRMRDAGEPWPKIRKEWLRLTGEANLGKSTLPNRYMRLKSNFTLLPDADQALLIQAKQEVEEEMASEKWARVGEKVAEKGGGKYLAEVLYLQWKKMMLSAEHLPAARDNAQKKSKWQNAVDEVAAGEGEE